MPRQNELDDDELYEAALLSTENSSPATLCKDCGLCMYRIFAASTFTSIFARRVVPRSYW